KLREEDIVGHGDAELAPLDGLGALISSLELGVHPLMAQETGTVLGDAVTAHETDGLAHHAGAMAGVPELARGAEDVGDGVEERMPATQSGGPEGTGA